MKKKFKLLKSNDGNRTSMRFERELQNWKARADIIIQKIDYYEGEYKSVISLENTRSIFNSDCDIAIVYYKENKNDEK